MADAYLRLEKTTWQLWNGLQPEGLNGSVDVLLRFLCS